LIFEKNSRLARERERERLRKLHVVLCSHYITKSVKTLGPANCQHYDNTCKDFSYNDFTCNIEQYITYMFLITVISKVIY
jgi:hypothetical protein